MYIYIAVSKNRGTPKSSILIGFSIINHPFWGTPILETSIAIWSYMYIYVFIVHIDNFRMQPTSAFLLQVPGAEFMDWILNSLKPPGTLEILELT